MSLISHSRQGCGGGAGEDFAPSNLIQANVTTPSPTHTHTHTRTHSHTHTSRGLHQVGQEPGSCSWPALESVICQGDRVHHPSDLLGPLSISSCWADQPLGEGLEPGLEPGLGPGAGGPACSILSPVEPVWALVLQLCHQRIFLGLAAAGASATQAQAWREARDLAAGGGREEGEEAQAVGGGWEERLPRAGSQAAGRRGCGAPRWRGKQEGLPPERQTSAPE